MKNFNVFGTLEFSPEIDQFQIDDAITLKGAKSEIAIRTFRFTVIEPFI